MGKTNLIQIIAFQIEKFFVLIINDSNEGFILQGI